MDINSVGANLAINGTPGSLAQDASILIFKKALYAQASSALQLISAIPIKSVNLPPNLGQNINTSV